MPGRMCDADSSAWFGSRLQDFLEDRAVEHEMPRLVLRHFGEDGREPGLVLLGDAAGLGVRVLRGPLLHRGVGEDAVGIAVPRRMEAGPDVLELHLLELPLVEELGVARVVVQDLAVPVLLGGPQVVPEAPVAVVLEIDGEQAVEMRQALFGEGVDRERRPHGIGNALRARAQVAQVRLAAIALGEAEQVGRHPQHALALVRRHHFAYGGLEILQDFELREEFARLVGETHVTFE